MPCLRPHSLGWQSLHPQPGPLGSTSTVSPSSAPHPRCHRSPSGRSPRPLPLEAASETLLPVWGAGAEGLTCTFRSQPPSAVCAVCAGILRWLGCLGRRWPPSGACGWAQGPWSARGPCGALMPAWGRGEGCRDTAPACSLRGTPDSAGPVCDEWEEAWPAPWARRPPRAGRSGQT